MSDGMSEYWRERRDRDKEERVIRDFIIFVNCLIHNQVAPHKMLKNVDYIMNQLFETMVIK